MANREKQPPIQLEEEDVQQDGEGQGSISYAGGGEAPSGGKRGLRVPSLGKKGPALGILQIFIPILAAVVISFLLTNTMAVSKGTYSSGMGALQASVDSRIQVEDAKITNVINNYASKSEIAGFLKASDLGGYAKASDLGGYATTGALATLQASVGSLSSSLTPTQIQALITAQLGNTSTYITKAQMDAAIGQAVIYLKSLITSGSSSIPVVYFTGSNETYTIAVGPVVGDYTSVKLAYTYASVPVSDILVLTSLNTPPMTVTYSSIGPPIIVTGVTVTWPYPSWGGGYWIIKLPYLDKLGTPTSVVVTPNL